MKKFLLSRWETICFSIVAVGFFVIILQILLTVWPSHIMVLILLILSTAYSCIALIQLIKQLVSRNFAHIMRRFAHLVQCVLIAINLALEFQGGRVNIDRAAQVLYILISFAFVFNSIRVGVWLVNRVPYGEDNHDG